MRLADIRMAPTAMAMNAMMARTRWTTPLPCWGVPSGSSAKNASRPEQMAQVPESTAVYRFGDLLALTRQGWVGQMSSPETGIGWAGGGGWGSYAGGMRLVSLLPSATEIVYALGLGDDLAGVTFECDEPPTARTEKTIVVGGLDTSGMAPGDIDRYVRSRLAAGEDLYTLHARALAGLMPDLILTQDLCRVCALPSGHVTDALEYLGCRADVLTLDPHSLDDVLDSILLVGRRAGVPERAERLVAGLRERLAAVAARVAGRSRPRVAVIVWVDPPFTAGHWVPDLVAVAGGRPVAARPGRPSVQTNWAAVAAAEPDLVVVAPCGYHLAGAAEQALAAAGALPGVPVWAIDADGIVVRPGPRLVNGVEALAAIIHPEAVPPAPPGSVRLVTAGFTRRAGFPGPG
jgi:iron complex transport system substrate-binding protein